ALGGIAPRPRHANAPRPLSAFAAMAVAVVLMAISDLCGATGVASAQPGGALAAIAAWNLGLGLGPVLVAPSRLRRDRPWHIACAAGLGVVFAAFIATIAAAFALIPERGAAVATVNIVVACRGVVAILLVLALDRWLAAGLEPIPRWVHAIRLAGAVILAAAVALALRR
ncbi:MAG: hypothetical protein H0W72_13180, partial [Planctomycetes bacterium]|nr:hypothetical protein [Planctomycetota bacterium]